jgi:hypothetical protein
MSIIDDNRTILHNAISKIHLRNSQTILLVLIIFKSVSIVAPFSKSRTKEYDRTKQSSLFVIPLHLLDSTLTITVNHAHTQQNLDHAVHYSFIF